MSYLKKISYMAVGKFCTSLFDFGDFVDMIYLGDLEEKESYATSMMKLVYSLTKETISRAFSPKYNYQDIIKEK